MKDIQNSLVEKAFKEILEIGIKIGVPEKLIIKKILEILYYGAKVEQSNNILNILNK